MEEIRSNLPFKESQIICLEYIGTNLYGEVIQLIPERGMCWFRPICMTESNNNNFDSEHPKLMYLQSGSDLLWPICLFRPALDTEVIGLLAECNDTHKNERLNLSFRQYFNQFVQKVWAANQDKF